MPSSSAALATTCLERGQTIDRFVVIGLVGRGGMGEVYAAYDPELDRKVAIKLLRARDDATDGRTRLLREAQAIAKLSHPNVVVVYDVGTFGDSIFIAMEFIEGRTLSGWMLAAPRSQRDIVEVFVAAGRGLAAAHAAGLVHRDFKPDNVMVTNDGQVRVMDFGLARQSGAASKGSASAAGQGAPPIEAVAAALNPDLDATVNIGRKDIDEASTTTSKYLSVKLTQTGAMMGTPAYMAPEQFAMKPTDPRTDQFAFCVALHELLYGSRPFAGDTLPALMASVTTGTVREAPAKSRVPGALRKVLLRGLGVDPDSRYPSMAALLEALETDPRARGKRLMAAVGVAACLAVAGFGARRAAGSSESLCRNGADRWASVWEPGVRSRRKDDIHRLFLATGKTYAEQAFVSASRLMDDYASRWLTMYTDACEATHVRGEQSAEVLDLRMSCLGERLVNASALSEIFSRADARVVENAVSAVGALPSLDRCADVASLRAVVKPPEDEALRKKVESLVRERAHLVALKDSGHCDEAARLVGDLIPRVEATGYLPLVAETRNAAGVLSDTCLDAAAGVEHFRAAFAAGMASHDDEAATIAAVILPDLLADRLERPEPAREWLTVAKAMTARASDPLLSAWVLNSEVAVLEREHRYDEAIRVSERAVDAKERLLGRESRDVAGSLNTMGNVLVLAGRTEDALRAFTRSREIFTKALGPDHPAVALIWSNGGEALNALHRHAEAAAGFRRALEIWRQSGSDAIFVSYGLMGLGLATLGEGRGSEAVEPLERSLEIRLEKHVGPTVLGDTRFALARALWARPVDRARALTLARLARLDYADGKGNAEGLAKIDGWLSAPAARL